MRKPLLIAAGLLVGLLLAEAALRLTTDPRATASAPKGDAHGRWISHPFLPVAGRPNASFRLENRGPDGSATSEEIRTNSYGFRTHEFPPFETAKSPMDFVVVCLGGSTTYGKGAASNAETWPELLEAMLARAYPQRRIRVYNFGLDRATTAVSVVNMALVGVHLNPDLVIVYQGYNDLAALGYANHRTDHAHFYADVHPERLWSGVRRDMPGWMLNFRVFERSAIEIDRLLGVNDLAHHMALPKIATPEPLHGIETTLENLRTIDSLARASGGRALFSTFQFRDGDDANLVRFNERLRTFFETNAMEFVDQAALLPDRDPALQTDECHFTPAGRALLATHFFNHIVARLSPG